jgi:hypothetical protein
MTKFRTQVSPLACAIALALSVAATPAAAEGGPDSNVIYVATAGGGAWQTHGELPELPKPSMAQKGSPSPPTAQSRLFSYRLDLLAPQGRDTGHSATGRGSAQRTLKAK